MALISTKTLLVSAYGFFLNLNKRYLICLPAGYNSNNNLFEIYLLVFHNNFTKVPSSLGLAYLPNNRFSKLNFHKTFDVQ